MEGVQLRGAPPRATPDGPRGPRRRRRILARLSFGHVVMIVSGLLAFLLTFSLLRAREETTPVAVAARDIPAGTPVDARSFRFTEVRVEDDVLATLLRPGELEAVTGWVAASTIRAGDLVSRSDLRPAAAPGGLGAMSIPVEREHAVGGALAPGDRVDVIEVREGVARYLVQGAEVLAVGSQDRGGFVEGSIGTFSVTIAVDAQAALDIARAIREAGVEIVRTTGATERPAATPSPG